MSIHKISVATLLLLSLTACSSSGSSSPNSNNVDEVSAKLSQTENALNKVKSELQQAEADKTSTAQALSTAKANLAAAEQNVANANREKQAVESELNNAKSELAKVQNDLQTAQIAATEANQAKTNAEKALADKTAVWNEIVSKGRESFNSVGKQHQRTSLAMDEQSLPTGLSKHPFISVTNDNLDGIFVGNYYIYVSPQSDMKVFGRANTAFWNDAEFTGDKSFRIQQIRGTLTDQLPVGTATYNGVAFVGDVKGKLNYAVDFGAKTAQGQITSFNKGLSDIQLQQGNITERKRILNEGWESQTYMIEATARNAQGDNGLYRVDFFGENAESLGGKLYMFQTYEGVPQSNGMEQEDFGATSRGTALGLAAER